MTHAMLLSVVSLLAVVQASLRSFEGYTFEAYLAEFNKSYSGNELQRRKALFEVSLQKVLRHNARYAAGEHEWFMAMNALADWGPEEFAQLRSTKYSPGQHPMVQLDTTGPNPEAVDWRQKGAVTQVKNQGMCGSCWAFAAVETVESHYQIASGRLVELAPQTYVDCVENPSQCGGTGGCKGATAELAFNLTVTRGLATEVDMPYKGTDGQCPQYTPAVKATGYVKLPTNDAKALETALATAGPVSVSVAADAWMLYGGGVFQGCTQGNSTTLDHAVQAVGYTKDYWIVRNSWGASWGEQGFIRLSRASDTKTFIDKRPADGSACKPYPQTQTVAGECGVLFDTSYPIGVAVATSNTQAVVV